MTKILIAEHDPNDLEMVNDELSRSGINYITEVVQNEPGFINALKNFIPDIVLSDYAFPSFDGYAAFKIKEQVCPDTPFILVSGTIGEENSIELIKNGITDFVLKDKMFTLNTKLRRALKDAENKKQKNKTDKELAQSETHLAEAQKLAKMGSWDFDIEGDRLTWSKELYNVFGADKKNPVETYSSFMNLVDEEDRLLVQQTSRYAQVTGEPFTLEYHITTALGEKRIIREHGHGKKDETGKITRLFGTAQDITESRRSEDAVRKATEEKYIILERIDDGFFATNKDSIVTYWNKRAEMLLDTKKEDVIGKNLHEVFDSKASGVFYDQYQKAISENSTVHFEEFSKQTNKWFAVSAFGSDNGLSVYFKDVTERKQSENKLKESELRYRSLIEQATDAICITDASLKFVNINPYACEVFGYTQEEALQLALTDILFTEDLAENPLKVDELKLGKTMRNERRLKRKNGTAVVMAVSTKVMENGMLIMFGHDITERKKAEQLISESEKKYRQIVETAQEGIWMIDENNKTIFVNKKMCELLEYTEEEMIGRTNLSFKDVAEQKKALEQIERRKQGLKEIHESTYITKSGRTICTQVSTNPLLDESGAYKGALAMVTDITAKKKSEQQLIMQEKRYRAIVENGADAVVILTAEGKPVYASPTIEKVLGYTDAEALRLDLFSMFHPDDIAWAVKVWEQLMVSPGIPVPVRPSRMIHKDGTWHWLEGTLTNLLHDPAVLGIVDNFRDVTAKKELENLLNKTNSLARIGSWEVDMVKNSLYWSDITKEIHEAGEDFMPDMETSINFYKNEESRNTITQKFKDAIEKGFPFDVELQITTAKENEKWVRVLGEAEFENGKALKINGSFQDITDRKLAEIQLNELNENIKKHAKELAISNAELEQFAYVASHDLQEPLRMITSFLTQLEKKYGALMDAKGKLYIDFAVDGARRMRQIILDLLEFSKVGKTADGLENVDLNELVDEIKILFRKKIEDENAQVIVDPLPQILADRTPMRQVFQNLVSNALKYSMNDKPSQIHITAKDLQTHWQFAVSDNGIGIAEEYFDKIFIIFQRLHNKDEFSGTGMGLAIVKKIIEARGGKIWLESAEGKGSTFYFTMLKQH